VTGDTWTRTLQQLPYLVQVLLVGAVTTVEVTAGGFVVAAVLGIVFAVAKTAPSRILRAAASGYVEIFRAVPVLTQLFIIYFGLADIGIKLDPLPAAITGFGINGGAYLTEVFRAGIEAVHQGQMEAAQALGMTRLGATRYIILPQAIRVVLPPVGNFAIGLLKDTSVASAVAAPELTFRARTLVDQTFLSTQIYLMVAILYLVMSLPLSRIVRRLEARMGRGQLT
jgi:polar amino acid transport system permease protein/cystine transport system permease protein